MGILKPEIVPRAYQTTISQSALQKGNTLVVLPTGMGKTLIAFLVVEEKLKEGRVVFLAPTKPLVQQHYQRFLESANFPQSEVSLITGEISPKKRGELWQKRICFSTPQSFKNDILAGRTDASCSLCVIDEAHRAVGNYAYTFIASQVVKEGGQILGMTASPGGSRARIQQIVDALGIQNIEIRTQNDPDVSPYIQKLDIEHVQVQLGKEFSAARALLSKMLSKNAEYLANLGFPPPLKSKKGLVELRARIMRASDRVKYQALSLYSTVFNLVHMLELIETQGLSTFLSYVEKLKARKETKARRRIFSDPLFLEALRQCGKASEHPKMGKLLEIVLQKKPGEKFLVFTQYRDQVKAIVDALKANGVLAERFVGKKEGVTAEEQKMAIERFFKGEFDVLVATSIGEEGLDIPSVDTVVFFEPIPSEIRTIQRRGRAGRLKAGRVVVLITKGTRDEAYFYSSRKKEENMKRIVSRMQLQFSMPAKEEKKKERKSTRKGVVQTKLTDFQND
ncbi:MAG: helicase-related protein [Candidatus Anstonellaceae archaeon]